MSLGPTVDIEVVNATVEIASNGATVTVDVPETTVDITGVGPQGPAGTGAEGYYGQFYDTTDQIAASTTVAYPVKFNTTESSNGVSVVNNGSGDPTRITFAHNAVYNVQFSLQFKNTASQDALVNIWFRLDGVDIADSNSQYTIPQKHGSDDGALIAALNLLVEPADNQYVELIWQTENTAISLQTLAAGTTPTTPVTPSAILTATQVMNLQEGPQGPAGQGVPTGGTTGQVLTKSSATNYDTTWATPTAAGLVRVKTQTISAGATTVVVTNAFSSTYRNYLVVIDRASNTITGASIRMTLGSTATGYYYAGTRITYGGSGTNTGASNAAFWFIGYTEQASWNGRQGATVSVYSPQLSKATTYTSLAYGGDSVTTFGGLLNDEASYTGFSLTISSGSFQEGTIAIYGYTV